LPTAKSETATPGKKKNARSPVARRRRKKASPTAKFITNEENSAIAEYLKNNEVTRVAPFDPEAPKASEEEA